MVIAILTAQLSELTSLIDILGLQEWDYIVMFVLLFIAGPGPLSVDGLIRRTFETKDK